MNLSANALKLYNYLLSTNGAWDGNCLDHVFNKPRYSAETKTDYWIWQANAYNANPSAYIHQLSRAYQELKSAGLANERNSGYNDYFYYPVI